jgi:hypothetical protein
LLHMFFYILFTLNITSLIYATILYNNNFHARKKSGVLLQQTVKSLGPYRCL